MKKFALKSAVLAIGALATASAFAALSLDTAPTANKYASELKITTTVDLLDGANTDLNLSATHGVSPGVNVTSYVRVDLSNGAKFKTNSPTLAVGNGTVSATGAGTGSLSSGGAGSSFAIFALSPTNPAHSIQADGVVTLTTDAAGITVANTGTVTAQIRVFETLTAAANPASSLALKDTTARNFITFTTGLTTTITKGALTAEVNPTTGAAYTSFTPVVALGSSLGQVTWAAGLAAGLNGVNATVSDLLQNTNDLVVTGDFSFVKGASEAYGDAAVKARVFLNDASTCAGTTVASTVKTVSASSVVFDDVAAAGLATVGGLYVCVKPEGTVAIPAGAYTVAATYTPQAAYTVPSLSAATLGDIVRNGTTLVAPLTNQPANWFSRLVLTNTGATDRTYTVTAVKEDGSTVTLTGEASTGTVKANTTKVVTLAHASDPTQSLATIVAGPSGRAATGLQVVVNGPKAQISGAYQIVSPSGNISNVNLVEK